jgi:iron complex transport system substrate-binding protein
MTARLLLVLLIFSFLIMVTSAYPYSESDTSVSDALGTIRLCQQDDGGFAEEGRNTNPGTSWSAMMAIVAAGEDPRTWTFNGVSAVDYWTDPENEGVVPEGTAEYGKFITLIVAMGEEPRDFNGVDYVAGMKERMKGDGHFGDHIYTQYWGMLALAGAGEDASKPVAWLKAEQNDDGGFGWTPGAESDADDTAASVMAFIATGEPADSPVIQSSLDYLRSVQMNDGGFNYGGSSSANAASDAWAIQAIVAAGEDPKTWKKNGNDVVSHLCSLQTEKGYFKWMDMLTDNPCKMTSTAVPALLGKPFPIFPAESPVDAPTETTKPSAITSLQVSPTKQPQTPLLDGKRDEFTVIDDYGHEITMYGTPERIVSLAPSNTEILFALGLDDRIIGVTDYCNYPPEANEIEKMGGYSSPNVEKILASEPDLIVGAFGNTEEVYNYLTGLDLTVLALNPQSIEDVIEDIELVGRATETEERAAVVCGDLRRRINDVTQKTSTMANRPTVVHVVWYDPLWVSGGDTFQDEMFEMAGGENAFPEIRGWGTVTMETFITKNPDIIIVNEGTGMGEAGKNLIYEYIINEPRFQNLNAVKNGNVHVINSDIIDRGGPRIVDALEIVASYIHPELFGSPAPATPAGEPAATGFALIAIPALIAAASLVMLLRKE